jgi:hypothetical protein
MNVHQHIIPTITTILPNVHVPIIKAMKFSIGHTIVLVSYQQTWQPLVTPFVLGKTNVLLTSTYPTWYNVIPLYILLNLNLYPTYPIGRKRFNPFISMNYTCYVPRYVHFIL